MLTGFQQRALYEDEIPDYSVARFPDPREFQARALGQLYEGRRAGHRCQMLMAPTGAGKTYLGLRLCHQALQKGKRATFLCDRTTLIDQTSATADRYGLNQHGIIQADHWRVDKRMPFQIASAQTIARRGWHDTDLIIVDEAHTQLSVWTEHVKATAATCILLSATPFSKGLGLLASNLVNAATMHELTESGVLVPMRVNSCTSPNMSGAATAGGEWTDRAAEERGMEIVGDVVAEWVKHGENRKTICFGATVKHCEELCNQFVKAGIMAALYTGHTTPEERKDLLKEYTKPDSNLRVLISVEALAKGFDVPDVGCVIDCRPLRKSLSTAVQMWGRGLRSSPETGKVDCLLHDHSGNIIRFERDFVELFYNGLASLDAGSKLDSKVREDPTDDKPVGKCPACGFKPFSKRCLACGHETPTIPQTEHQPGEMQAITLSKGKTIDRLALYEQCVAYARKHSKPEKQEARARGLYKDMAGEWPSPSYPPFANVRDVPISKEVQGKVVSLNIRKAKSSYVKFGEKA